MESASRPTAGAALVQMNRAPLAGAAFWRVLRASGAQADRPAAIRLAQQQRGDEEAADGEKDVDADEPTAKGSAPGNRW